MSSNYIPPVVHIGKVVRNATVFNLKRRHGANLSTDSLIETVSRLFFLLHQRQVQYVLVGGIALLQYVEGRNTEDIDLIMSLSSLERLPEIHILSQDADFARGTFKELQIDILLTRNRLFQKVRQRYATVRPFVERDIRCATVEGLMLLKLYALPSLYRQGNFTRVSLYENDIATLLHDYKPDVVPLLKELALHLSDTDLAAVREILAEIEQRIERFGRGLGAGS
jgi:hypothetical protein